MNLLRKILSINYYRKLKFKLLKSILLLDKFNKYYILLMYYIIIKQLLIMIFMIKKT